MKNFPRSLLPYSTRLQYLRSAARNGLGLSVSHEQAVAVLLFFLTALLISADLIPTFDGISNWDESSYIASGRGLVDEAKLRIFSWSPLAMALYGLAYLPSQESPHWFVNTAIGGRVVIFVMFWFAVYMCGRSMAPSVNPNAVMIMAAIWAPFIPFLGNSSDALFMAMTGLALWNVVEYRSDNSLKRLALASGLVGLSACARNDGLVLFVSFLLLTALFTKWSWEGGTGHAVRVAVASVLPFLMITGAYVLAYGFSTGEFELGTTERTYSAFEAGHARTYSTLTDVQEIYGTRAENDWSVFKAIRRNPSAFLDRTARQMWAIPIQFSRAYGGAFAAILLFLAARGAVHLGMSRQGWLLGLALIWHLHLLSYSVTFWHPRYLQFPFIFLMIIGGIGAIAIVSNFRDWRERAAVILAVAAITVAGGILDADGSSAAVPAVLLAGLACYALALRFAPALLTTGLFRGLLVAVVCVAVVTVSHIGSRSRLPSHPDPSPAGQALQYLIETLPEGSVVAAYGQKMPFAARMMHHQLPPSLDTLRDLGDWLKENEIRAVYVDPAYKSGVPEAWRTLMDNAGPNELLFTGYSDPGSDTYVLLPSAHSRGG